MLGPLYSIAILATISSCACADPVHLTATALVTNAHNNSALECWRFEAPLEISTTSGTSGAATFDFQNVSSAVYTVIPGRFNGGTHNAPVPQLVAFMSGLAHITLPYPASPNTSLDEAWVSGGAQGLIVATDVKGTGHITTYPLDVATVSLQIPFSDGRVPHYSVLHAGPCHYSDAGGQESSTLADMQ